MRKPDDLRSIARLMQTSRSDADLAIMAEELLGFASFLEDLDGAKARKLAMQANMPPSRERLLQETIAFHQSQAAAGWARVEELEAALEAIRAAVGTITAAFGAVR